VRNGEDGTLERRDGIPRARVDELHPLRGMQSGARTHKQRWPPQVWESGRMAQMPMEGRQHSRAAAGKPAGDLETGVQRMSAQSPGARPWTHGRTGDGPTSERKTEGHWRGPLTTPREEVQTVRHPEAVETLQNGVRRERTACRAESEAATR
jgi:hypothetical protein